MVEHYTIKVGPFSRGFHIITDDVKSAVRKWPENGILQAFIRHTSAGLCISENADPTVRQDFNLYFDRMAPENLTGITHYMEGPDDMPSHIKSAITGASVQIPIISGQLALGTWQGIYLCEFRDHARKREIIISILS